VLRDLDELSTRRAASSPGEGSPEFIGPPGRLAILPSNWRHPEELSSGGMPFLFTAIEASTRRWEQDPEIMRVA
jgi:hypothetical protein